MSYDVYLEADTGGPEPVEAFWANHTSNTARMWRSAGCDLAEFDGEFASDLLKPLRYAIGNIEADRKLYRDMEPENGWGSVETTLKFLKEIEAACKAHPKTTVRVSR